MENEIEYINKIYKKIKIEHSDDHVLYNCYFNKDLYDLELELLDTTLVSSDFEETDKILKPHLKFLNKKCKRVYKDLLKSKEINKKYIKNNCLLKLNCRILKLIDMDKIQHNKDQIYKTLLNLDSENMTENEYLLKCKELKEQYINISENHFQIKDIQYIRYLPNENLLLLGYTFTICSNS